MNPILKRVVEALESMQGIGSDAAGTRNGPANYPRTYQPGAPGDVPAARPQVFEPALKQFGRAFRLGDPLMADAELSAHWHTARRLATAHVLRLVSGTPFADHLVLRGSVLL